jgi:predicted anti-sigma-YlaC factor YlaD
MSNCERFEMLVSAWLDAEIDRGEQVECVDHLVRCESCRRFYVDARSVDGLVALLRTPASGPAPSAGAWARIEAAARPRRRVQSWMLQAAAVVALAAGLYVVTWSTGGPVRPGSASDDIVLGADRSMTDARFLELTREVLEADPRYRVAMHQVLDQTMRDTVPREAPSGDLTVPPTEGTTDEPESRLRLPA